MLFIKVSECGMFFIPELWYSVKYHKYKGGENAPSFMFSCPMRLFYFYFLSSGGFKVFLIRKLFYSISFLKTYEPLL